jgi:uncharacterized protein
MVKKVKVKKGPPQMKKHYTCTALLAFLGCSRETPIPPTPLSFVTDKAGLLDAAMVRELEVTLQQAHQNTGATVFVYTDQSWPADSRGVFPSLEVYTMLLFNAWGAGQKGENNGVGLFIFAADRKIRIQVGSGLHAQLPDSEAARIINEIIAPKMRMSPPDAIKEGVTAILAKLRED